MKDICDRLLENDPDHRQYEREARIVLHSLLQDSAEEIQRLRADLMIESFKVNLLLEALKLTSGRLSELAPDEEVKPELQELMEKIKSLFLKKKTEH